MGIFDGILSALSELAASITAYFDWLLVALAEAFGILGL